MAKTTFTQGADYRKVVAPLIKTKLNSKADTAGIWVEVAQRHNSRSIQWHPSEWLTNDNEGVVVLGNDKIHFFFEKANLLRLVSLLPYKLMIGGLTIAIHMTAAEAEKYAAITVRSGTNLTAKVQNITARTLKFIQDNNL